MIIKREIYKEDVLYRLYNIKTHSRSILIYILIEIDSNKEDSVLFNVGKIVSAGFENL